MEKEDRRRGITLALFLLVPLAFAFAASWALPRSIWVPRNFIAAAGGLFVTVVGRPKGLASKEPGG